MGVQIKFKNLTVDNKLVDEPKKRYTISGTVSPEGSGRIVGLGTYNEGDTVVLTTVPNNGYKHGSWPIDNWPFCDKFGRVAFKMPACDMQLGEVHFDESDLHYVIGYDVTTKQQTERKDIAVLCSNQIFGEGHIQLDNDIASNAFEDASTNDYDGIDILILDKSQPIDNLIINAYAVSDDGIVSDAVQAVKDGRYMTAIDYIAYDNAVFSHKPGYVLSVQTRDGSPLTDDLLSCIAYSTAKHFDENHL